MITEKDLEAIRSQKEIAAGNAADVASDVPSDLVAKAKAIQNGSAIDRLTAQRALLESDHTPYLQKVWQNFKHGMGQTFAQGEQMASAPMETPEMKLVRMISPTLANKINPMKDIIPLEQIQEGIAKKWEGRTGAKSAPEDNAVSNFFLDAADVAGGIAATGGSGVARQGIGLMGKIGSRALGIGERELPTVLNAAKSLGWAGLKDVGTASLVDAASQGGAGGAGKLAETFGAGPEGQQMAREVGGFAGGAVGGAAGAFRANVTGTGLELGTTAGKGVLSSMKRASQIKSEALAEYKKAENTKTLSQIFSEKMAAESPETQSAIRDNMERITAQIVAANPKIAQQYREGIAKLEEMGIPTDQIKSTIPPDVLSGAEPLVNLSKAVKEGATVKTIPQYVKAEESGVGTFTQAWNNVKDKVLGRTARQSGLDPTEFSKGAEESLATFQQYAKEKEQTAATALQQTRDRVKPMTPDERGDIGNKLQDIQNEILYGPGGTKDKPTGGIYPETGRLYKESTDLLSFNRGDVTPVIQRIQELKKGTGELSVGKLIPDDLELLLEQPKSANLAKVESARKLIGGLIEQSSGPNQLPMQHKRVLTDLANELNDVIQRNASPEALQSLTNARSYYRDVYAPVAREGIPGGMLRGSSRLQAGETAIPAESVMDKFFGSSTEALPTTSKEFDTLFGGRQSPVEGARSIQRSEAAYQLQQRYVMGKLADRIGPKGITPEAFEQFKRDYKVALDRFPQLEGLITDHVIEVNQRVSDLAAAKKQNDAVINGVLANQLGVNGSAALLAHALPDASASRFMAEGIKSKLGNAGLDNLLHEIYAQASPFTNGEFNPAKLAAFIKSSEPGLAQIFQSRFGQAEGLKHLQTLKEYSELATKMKASLVEQVKATPFDYADPAQKATGTSVAGISGLLRSIEVGKTSGAFVLPYLGVRAVIARKRIAWEKAKEDMIANPALSNKMMENAIELSKGEIPGDVASELGKRLAQEDILQLKPYIVTALQAAMVGERIEQEKQRKGQ